jgi:hypothetical protein
MDHQIDSKKTLDWCIENSVFCFPTLSDDGETRVIVAKCGSVTASYNIEDPFDHAAIGLAVLLALAAAELGVKHYAKLKSTSSDNIQEDLGFK